MKTVVQILKDARALIADEKNWTQKSFARDSIGTSVKTDNSNATCFCALGALARVSGVSVYTNLPGEPFLEEVAWKSGEINVPEFNDHHTHSEVLALFDCAIARAESEAVQ